MCLNEFRRLKPPASIAATPAQMASTSAAVNYIISQINSIDTNTSCDALRQVCMCVLCYCAIQGWLEYVKNTV